MMSWIAAVVAEGRGGHLLTRGDRRAHDLADDLGDVGEGARLDGREVLDLGPDLVGLDALPSGMSAVATTTGPVVGTSVSPPPTGRPASTG